MSQRRRLLVLAGSIVLLAPSAVHAAELSSAQSKHLSAAVTSQREAFDLRQAGGAADRVAELERSARANYRAAYAGKYECVDEAPGTKQPPPTAPKRADGVKTIPEDFVQVPRLCAKSQVVSFVHDDIQKWAPPMHPKPTARAKRGAAPKRGRATKSSLANGSCDNYGWAFYCHAGGTQTVPWQANANQMWTSMMEAQPAIGANTSHSLAQIWGVDYTTGWPGSTQEFGWTMRPGMTNPVLFAYHFDGNNTTNYASCATPAQPVVSNATNGGFVCNAGSPINVGSPVWNFGQWNTYGIARYGTDWWFNYNGNWLGYIPQSMYPSYWNSGWLKMDAGGEIAAQVARPCTQMGNGIAANGPNAINAAAVGSSAWYGASGYGGSNSFSPMADSAYSHGYYWGNPSDRFRYGGPGIC